MNATAWVAITGITATLLASLLSPVLSERMRRKSARLERLSDLYADLLGATARFADNAMNWSATPLADLKETDDQELDRIVNHLRVIGSKKVYRRFEEAKMQIHKFNRLLSDAQDYLNQLRGEGGVDDQTSIQQRMALGAIADGIMKAHKELESIIRKEVGR